MFINFHFKLFVYIRTNLSSLIILRASRRNNSDINRDFATELAFVVHQNSFGSMDFIVLRPHLRTLMQLRQIHLVLFRNYLKPRSTRVWLVNNLTYFAGMCGRMKLYNMLHDSRRSSIESNRADRFIFTVI